jgi:hypothetical protein
MFFRMNFLGGPFKDPLKKALVKKKHIGVEGMLAPSVSAS